MTMRNIRHLITRTEWIQSCRAMTVWTVSSVYIRTVRIEPFRNVSFGGKTSLSQLYVYTSAVDNVHALSSTFPFVDGEIIFKSIVICCKFHNVRVDLDVLLSFNLILEVQTKPYNNADLYVCSASHR